MNIVVLAGGTSTERNVSIVSGKGVCEALRSRGHRAVLVDVFAGNADADISDPFPLTYDIEAAVYYIKSFDGKIEEMIRDTSRDFFGPNVIELCRKADIVFMALHGANGEDGRVQAAFDLMNIRYTGSGYLGSALAMSKELGKLILKNAGVPVPGGVLVRNDEKNVLPGAFGLAYPLVVKPNCGGSSVGVSIVYSDDEYRSALEYALELEREVVVEEYISGREFSVGVVGGRALPVIELAPIEGFYDYKNKYTAGSTIETCPADISPESSKQMQEYAETGYKALSLDAYARLDFIMKESGKMYCLEANTLPGMTPTSLLPQEAAAEGTDFGELCDILIKYSMEKYERGIV